jgi:hypothetical protein
MGRDGTRKAALTPTLSHPKRTGEGEPLESAPPCGGARDGTGCLIEGSQEESALTPTLSHPKRTGEGERRDGTRITGSAGGPRRRRNRDLLVVRILFH